MVVPNLLHDGAEAGYIGERICNLLNLVEKFAWNAQGGPVHQLCRAVAQILIETAAETWNCVIVTEDLSSLKSWVYTALNWCTTAS